MNTLGSLQRAEIKITFYNKAEARQEIQAAPELPRQPTQQCGRFAVTPQQKKGLHE